MSPAQKWNSAAQHHQHQTLISSTSSSSSRKLHQQHCGHNSTSSISLLVYSIAAASRSTLQYGGWAAGMPANSCNSSNSGMISRWWCMCQQPASAKAHRVYILLCTWVSRSSSSMWMLHQHVTGAKWVLTLST